MRILFLLIFLVQGFAADEEQTEVGIWSLLPRILRSTPSEHPIGQQSSFQEMPAPVYPQTSTAVISEKYRSIFDSIVALDGRVRKVEAGGRQGERIVILEQEIAALKARQPETPQVSQESRCYKDFSNSCKLPACVCANINACWLGVACCLLQTIFFCSSGEVEQANFFYDPKEGETTCTCCSETSCAYEAEVWTIPTICNWCSRDE